MDIKKFERAKEIEEIDSAIQQINKFINRGSILIATNSCNLSEKQEVIEVPDTIANLILQTLEVYQGTLEKEFEEL